MDGFAGLLGRAADDARDCRIYFGTWVPEISPVTGGIINPLTYEHLRVRRQLTAMLEHLVTLLDTSQDQLAAASAVYRRTDHHAAAALDNAYPRIERPTPRRD
ncbi:hypothetical protein [Actinoplanes sp. GCM10030250]|uniref:hypothetical protein n=1 Tax=Actinoplanes sp. GCM10030250 TaxID=3273376 RepID=UPI0036214264